MVEVATGITFVDDEVPEELAEGGAFTYAGQIVAIGFANAPKGKLESAAAGGYEAAKKMFVLEVKPLDHTLDTNKESFIYENEGNNYRDWLKYLDKNGSTITAKSPFGDVKAAFKRLGHSLITSQQMAQELVGKKFRFQSVGKKYFEAQAKPTWFNIPISELPDDYEYTGQGWTKRRGYEGEETAANKLDTSVEESAKSVLVPALVDKTPSEFVMAVATAGFGQTPFMLWAAQNGGQQLIEWAGRNGLTFTNGRLVKA